MDLMEVPSHVTEHFARAPAALRTFARHHASGRPIGDELAAQLQRSQTLFGALTLHQQVGLFS
jgi:intermediate peptidase